MSKTIYPNKRPRQETKTQDQEKWVKCKQQHGCHLFRPHFSLRAERKRGPVHQRKAHPAASKVRYSLTDRVMTWNERVWRDVRGPLWFGVLLCNELVTLSVWRQIQNCAILTINSWEFAWRHQKRSSYLRVDIQIWSITVRLGMSKKCHFCEFEIPTTVRPTRLERN